MTNHQKALHHLAEAEKWQAKVVEFEDDAYREAAQRYGGIKDTLYQQSQILKDHFWYHRAVANRNGHQTQATMYATIATMEALAK